MDLYLVSPVFLKKMMPRRPSAAVAPEELHNILPPDRQAEEEVMVVWNNGRRRSSFDRMLKRQAYIIICIICHALASSWQST